MSTGRTGVTRRALLIGIAAVLATQAATVYLVHRALSSRPAPAAAVAPPADAPQVQLDLLARRAAAEGAQPQLPSVPRLRAPDPVAEPVPRREPPRVAVAWAGRPLDDAGQKLAAELGWPADDLRLLTDGRGRVTDAARRDLLAGRDLGLQVAEQSGVGDRADGVANLAVGFMVRRVTMRESFRGSTTTPQAIDDAARSDALAMAEANFGARTRDALAAALTQLPDLTADLPPAP